MIIFVSHLQHDDMPYHAAKCYILLDYMEPIYLLLWEHILPYLKDGLVQPKHIRRA